jgi:hypothetical protein
MFAFNFIRIWCDNGNHFHSDLFFLYAELFGGIYFVGIVCNFHEAGEGRCWLDRYFGSLVVLERKYLLRYQDITGE